ncbi:hypothetical protein DFH27DRAFT_575386, partial [Peziza echinospora]
MLMLRLQLAFIHQPILPPQSLLLTYLPTYSVPIYTHIYPSTSQPLATCDKFPAYIYPFLLSNSFIFFFILSNSNSIFANL